MPTAPKSPKARIAQVEDEFSRIADTMIRQGDANILLDLVPLKQKAMFIVDWHEGDEGNSAEFKKWSKIEKELK